jgi:hypothetical protein
MEGLWTQDGPTPRAVALMEQDGGPLSSGERVLLLAAFALWNGRGSLHLADVIEKLDARPTEALCSLIIAAKCGADDVDAWLAEHEQTPG